MESLENFNNRRRQQYALATTKQNNGIACPKCGIELFDISPMITFASNPPKK